MYLCAIKHKQLLYNESLGFSVLVLTSTLYSTLGSVLDLISALLLTGTSTLRATARHLLVACLLTGAAQYPVLHSLHQPPQSSILI